MRLTFHYAAFSIPSTQFLTATESVHVSCETGHLQGTGTPHAVLVRVQTNLAYLLLIGVPGRTSTSQDRLRLIGKINNVRMKKTANLMISFLFVITMCDAQEGVPYGYNPEAGAYFDVGNNTRLYYEIYGKGEPLLMLHGGVYGYIEEFSGLIPKLAGKYRVICLATRGHVKSDIGHEPFTYEQRASDAYKLIQHLGLGKVTVIGFSDGGYSAYKLAAMYPDVVAKMVVMGAGDNPKGRNFNYSAEGLRKATGNFFDHKVANMPEPDRWDESLQMLNELYKNSTVSIETFRKIRCPVLVMSGEKDEYSDPESILKARESIDGSKLVIIPECGHVIFSCDFDSTWDAISDFLDIGS